MASDAAPSDEFGWSAALSGGTALIGANKSDGLAIDSGSAYVFVQNGSTWTEQAKLIAPDAAESAFGGFVALAGDTALVGASDADDMLRDNGSAYLFLRVAGAWKLETTIVVTDGEAIDFRARSVALSGNTVLVGAPAEDRQFGAAYVLVLVLVPCGNGVINEPETCDDANETDGDGCSASCAVETGYSCTGVPSVCTDDDECMLGTDNCSAHASCGNTAGGFECSCYDGFSGDGIFCAATSSCGCHTGRPSPSHHGTIWLALVAIVLLSARRAKFFIFRITGSQPRSGSTELQEGGENPTSPRRARGTRRFALANRPPRGQRK